MRILLVNDDGILAPGLAALHAAVRDMGEVYVVAPDSPQSAAGRSLTLHAPIFCQQVHVGGAFWGWGVSGRPADCVKLAIRELVPCRPDLVLSGINAGANVGVNVYYSGTVAAAAEGALMGLPSVAFSLASGGEFDFQRAARYCRAALDHLLAVPIGPGELINVNIPEIRGQEPRGIQVLPQSTAAISESYIRQEEGGRLIFRLADEYAHGPQDAPTDVTAIDEGYITVTPLHSDMTNHKRLGELARSDWNTQI